MVTMENQKMLEIKRIILASSSPRRKELLELANISFIVKPASIVEKIFPLERPEELVCRLAKEKAYNMSQRFPEKIVLGADTVVYLNGLIMGKPANIAHAKRMLQQLSDNTHHVFTGVCLTRRTPEKELTWYSVTAVKFRSLTSELIDFCVENGNPLDKAGAYAIQDHEDVLIQKYDGLRSNVMGLPVEEVVSKLATF